MVTDEWAVIRPERRVHYNVTKAHWRFFINRKSKLWGLKWDAGVWKSWGYSAGKIVRQKLD